MHDAGEVIKVERPVASQDAARRRNARRVDDDVEPFPPITDRIDRGLHVVGIGDAALNPYHIAFTPRRHPHHGVGQVEHHYPYPGCSEPLGRRTPQTRDAPRDQGDLTLQLHLRTLNRR